MKSVSSRLDPAPTCCEKYVPPGFRTRRISSHCTSVGWRLTNKSKLSSAKGRPSSSPTSTTVAPRRARLRFAISMLGGQESVATSIAGALAMPARTSPPPVCMSNAADARCIFAAIISEYPHRGRSSVARPSNHEKSHPSTETEFASATRSSKLRDTYRR